MSFVLDRLKIHLAVHTSRTRIISSAPLITLEIQPRDQGPRGSCESFSKTNMPGRKISLFKRLFILSLNDLDNYFANISLSTVIIFDFFYTFSSKSPYISHKLSSENKLRGFPEKIWPGVNTRRLSAFVDKEQNCREFKMASICVIKIRKSLT